MSNHTAPFLSLNSSSAIRRKKTNEWALKSTELFYRICEVNNWKKQTPKHLWYHLRNNRQTTHTQSLHLGFTIYFAWRQPILQPISQKVFWATDFFFPSTSKFKIWNHMFANKECCKRKKPYVQQKVYKHNVYSLITVFEVNTKWRRGGKGKLKHLG